MLHQPPLFELRLAAPDERREVKRSASFEALAKKDKYEEDMFFVYILQSVNNPRQFYTGFSADPHTRLKEHNSGKSIHTNKFKPWKLIFYCAFPDKKTALDFELYLKTASGIAFRNKRFICDDL